MVRGPWTVLVALGLLVASGCTNESSSLLEGVSDEEILLQGRNWPNQVGISANDPDLWRERLNQACTEGVWDHDVAFALAEGFMTEDLEAGLSIFRGNEADRPTVEDAALALWLAAVNVCRGQFPPESIDRGPPGFG